MAKIGYGLSSEQFGPDMDGFFTAWQREVLPQLR
jgi:hypothetical protein